MRRLFWSWETRYNQILCQMKNEMTRKRKMEDDEMAKKRKKQDDEVAEVQAKVYTLL
jgi:hypothetical protein